MDYTDKVVILYGGTSGIGKELLFALVSKGCNVIFTGTNEIKGNKVLEELNILYKDSRPHNAIFQCSDITDWAGQEELYPLAEETFGKTVDIVLVIAGILDTSNLINDIEQDGKYRTIEVNLTAAIKANRLAIQYFLKKKKGGCIVNTSSVFGLTGACTAPLYAASKHAIIGLTKSYGSLLRTTDIRVNVVAPHFVETPLLPGVSLGVATTFGMVSMKDCIEAYFYVLEDETLNGDVVNVSHLGRTTEPRYSDPIIEQLDTMCNQRREDTLNGILNYFQ
ncbi:hypothetical protein INT47_002093 [Mucor saturninus]|uniref:NAD(P)-binding protein n=1 Tax=Mucor saturninus TaxID=64648 RepID=A0A8H7R1I0_9FUNG|nr:hypothetical protein INT47_002093 [Mucor saturninus]